MTDSTTLTVRMTPELKKSLGLLADRSRRTRSFLANAAIENYVEREMAIVAGITRGLEDRRVGNVIEHETAMDELDAAIEVAALKRP